MVPLGAPLEWHQLKWTQFHSLCLYSWDQSSFIGQNLSYKCHKWCVKLLVKYYLVMSNKIQIALSFYGIYFILRWMSCNKIVFFRRKTRRDILATKYHTALLDFNKDITFLNAIAIYIIFIIILRLLNLVKITLFDY